MKKATAAWVRKAEADYQLAADIARGRKRFHDQQCFHCQQASEKYLKALLEELGLAIPHTHNLDALLSLLVSHHAPLGSLRRGLIYLSDFAVGTRYPGDDASKRQAAAAFRWAGRVRDLCRVLLGIRVRQRRRRSK